MFRLIKYCFLFVVVFSFISCEKGDFNLFSVKRKLQKNTWKVNSCINNESNSNYNITGTKYEFKKNGDFVIYYEKSGEIKKTNWQLTDNDKYLRIGNNTFKIKIITNKLLGLRYGNMDIYYIPAD
jgi:hypothetical protein